MTNAAEKQEKTRKYPCDICSKKFLGKNDLRKHIRTHTDERPYVCKECGRGFRQAGSLKNHVACKHSPGLQSNEVFVCDYCNKHFPIKERLRLHIRVHTGVRPYECDECGKKFARGGQLLQHRRSHTRAKPYVCQICSSGFTCSTNLRLHMNRHLDIRDFVCDICGKSFFRRDALKKHLNCYHSNLKAFHCNLCNKDFKGHLKQHIQTTHNKEKPYGCAHCGVRFSQRSQLTVHNRLHSGEKPFRCQVCWKAFAHSTALKLHTLRHTGEKPFQCLLCKASFTQLPHLKKHMMCIHKTSKPYVCTYCKTYYKVKVELEEHHTKCRKLKRLKKTNKELDTVVSNLEPSMPIGKMRLLLAVLLKKISAPERLDELGFNKRLIDDILEESIENSGREPCKEDGLTVADKLRKNVQILLEWTVPKHYMEKFKSEQRSTEELLEELTS